MHNVTGQATRAPLRNKKVARSIRPRKPLPLGGLPPRGVWRRPPPSGFGREVLGQDVLGFRGPIRGDEKGRAAHPVDGHPENLAHGFGLHPRGDAEGFEHVPEDLRLRNSVGCVDGDPVHALIIARWPAFLNSPSAWRIVLP